MNEDITLSPEEEEDNEECSSESTGVKRKGIPTASQLAKINKMAKVEMSAEDVFVFECLMVGTKEIPRRNTRLSKKLIDSFAKQIRAGIAQIDSHLWSSVFTSNRVLPFGKSFDAKVKKCEEVEEDGTVNYNLYGSFYIPKGIEIDGMNTDDIINGVKTGILSDTSIGFTAEKETCSVCGLDYFGGECRHYKGEKYEGIKCVTTLDAPGTIMENSFVFDGAYPEAGVTSLSTLSNNNANQGHCYRINSRDMTMECVSNTNAEGGSKLEKDFKQDYFELKEKFDALSAEGATALASATEESKAKDEQIIELQAKIEEADTKAEELGVQLAEKDTQIVELQAKIEELSKDAQFGQTYVQSIVDSAITEGIRVFGNAFNEELQRKLFNQMSVEEVAQYKEAWEKMAIENLTVAVAVSQEIKEVEVNQFATYDEALSAKAQEIVKEQKVELAVATRMAAKALEEAGFHRN